MIAESLAIAAVDALLGGVISLSAAEHIRRMNSRTRHSIRAAFVLLCVGGFALATEHLFAGCAPGWQEVAAHAGIAALLLTDRRRPTDCPHVDDCDWQRRHPTPSQWP